MNIHEYQAKKILSEFGAPVSKGIVIFSINEINKKILNFEPTVGLINEQAFSSSMIKIYKNFFYILKILMRILTLNTF